MFNKYFGFRENPFSENHDIDYFYLNNSNKQLYSNLLNDIYHRVDLTLILGDWGVGKTAFLQQLIGIDPFQIKVLYFHDTGQWQGLVDYLCNEMALVTDRHDNQGKEQLLAEHLTEMHQQGIIPVLIVDNTQELEDESLAPLLRLSGQRIAGQPLIQVILAAVPAFMAHFDFPVLQRYKSSIARKYQLKALTAVEVGEYIHFRLRQAGCEREDLFSDSAIEAIVDRSEGIPQLINKLCNSALLFASVDGHQMVDEKIIDEASKHCLLWPDTVGIDEVDDTSTINNLSDPIIPDPAHSSGTKAGTLYENTASKPFRPWSSQLIRYGGTAAVALTLLLTGIMILLLKTETEQKPKEKTDNNLAMAQSSKVKDRANTKLLSAGKRKNKTDTLSIRTTQEQEDVVRRNRSEIVTPKTIQATDREPVIADKKHPKSLSPAQSPILSEAKLPLSEEVAKDVVTSQEPPFQDKSEEKSSGEHRSEPEKPSTQNELLAMFKPPELDEKEQQAKKRSLARLKLKQSNIEFGIESLMIAADTADNKALELLLTGGIPPDIQEKPISLTALAIAAANGHIDTVQFLLSQEATIDIRNFKGRTALMAAAGNGHSETVYFLLNSGAQVNITDSDGWTALMFAVYSNHLKAVQVLLEWGAEYRLKNSVGRTALQIARSQGHKDVMDLVAERAGINTQ